MEIPKIVIAEDELMMAREMSGLLVNMGYRVVAVAATGEDVLTALDDLSPDLLLLDIDLKGDMRGVELADQSLLQHGVPVVFITPNVKSETGERVQRPACYGVVQKPIQRDVLRAVVDLALHRRHLENQLSEREFWLHATLQSIDDGVVSTDDQGRIVMMNAVAETLCGCTAEEATGQSVKDVFPIFNVKNRKPAEDFLEKALTLEERWDGAGQYLIVSREGAGYEVNARVSTVQNSRGRLTGAVLVFKDIAEIGPHEAEKNESQRKLLTLMSNLPGLVYSCLKDANWTMKFISRGSLALTGYAPDELIDNKVVSYELLIHPDDREHLRQRVEAAVAQKVAFTCEYRILHRDGSVKWVWERGCGIYSEKGDLTAIEGFIHDINERKRAEEALQASSLATETAMSAIFIADLTGRITYANAMAAEMWGYTGTEEMIGSSALSYWTESTQPKAARMIDGLMEKGSVNTFGELTGKRLDGSEFIVESKSVIQKDSTGRMIGMIGSFSDITEHIKAEQALRESEARFELAMNATRDGLFDWDLRSNEIYYSPGWKKMLGYEYDALPNAFSVWESLTAPEDVAKCYEMQQELINKKRDRFEIEFRMRHKQGHWVDILSRASVYFDAAGEPARMVGTHVDITDRKRTAKALEKRMVALTRPLDDVSSIHFEELFNLKDIQRLQDEFTRATGAASMITDTHGSSITSPSNFCRLCKEIIRETETGRSNCLGSNAIYGQAKLDCPVIQPCPGGGLLGAGVAITVGGKHIANWLIGQVRDEAQTEENMRDYARKIGADEEDMVAAFMEVPAMSQAQFRHIVQAFCTLAHQLSDVAYQNIQQARFIVEREKAEKTLAEHEARLRTLIETIPDYIWLKDIDGVYLSCNPRFEQFFGAPEAEIVGKTDYDFVEKAQADFFQERDRIAMAAGKPSINEEEVTLAADGRRILLETIKTPMYDAKGRLLGILGVARDITERKKMEMDLSESEEKYRSLVTNTLQGVVIAQSAPVRLSYVNPAMTTITGYAKPELLEMGEEQLSMLIHPHDLQRFFGNFHKRLNGEEAPQQEEYRIVSKEGTIKWMSTWSSLIDYLGSPATLSAFMEITERKQAEEALKESEKRFRALHNASFGGIAIHDNGVILECNQGLSQITGFTYHQLVGMDLLQLISEDARNHVLKNITSGFERPYEAMGIRKNGEIFPVRLEARQVPYQGKSVRVAEFRDITEQKQAEEALRESEELFRKLITTVPDVIIRTDLKGQITFINEAALTSFPFLQKDQVLGVNMMSFLVEEERTRALENTKRMFNEQLGAQEYQLTFGGQIIDCEIKGEIIRDANAQPLGMVYVIRDITERKRAVEQIEKSLKEKTVLLKEVHHRVKNNMNVITSLLALQKERIQSKEEALASFDEAQHRVHSMALVHEQLYHHELFSEMDIGQYLKRLVAGVNQSWGRHVDISTRIAVEPGLLDINQAVPLGMLLNEVITNAYKHAFKGRDKGAITIIGKRLKDNRYSVEVKDDGVGLPVGYQVEAAKTLGMRLISLLAEQSDSVVKIKRLKKGTKCTLKFEVKP